MKILPFAACAAVLFLAPHAAAGEPITFDDALSAASANAPQVQADTLLVEAQQSASIPAASLPDPRLGVAVENFPISGPPAFSLSQDEMTMVTVSASQEIPSSAKRRARVARAQADIGAARASLALTERQVRIEAALAWLDLAYAERRLAALDDAVARISAYEGSSTAGVGSGSVRPAQSLEVRKAVASLQDERAELEAQRGRAAAALARWTGNHDPEASGPMPMFEIDPERLADAIDRHPQLGVAIAQARQAEADVELARAEKRPDLMADVAYQHRDPGYGDMISAGVTVSLPLFAERRQDPLITARVAEAGAAQARREDARRELHAELDAALADHAMHHDQLERARTTLLPLARQQSDLDTASYAAGRASLADVIAARTELAETELLLLDREIAVAKDAARLVLAYGGSE
ncbi:TolC family protein [Altererythrobacter sp. Root672]|uniref:TolC family protein n=1 Tax=Altererythrobacter sp. Root672 TaxID=1736584 RepID=UPI0006F8C37C|nr:TolC family protein [Altererythrobacter sp. Root672]KRA81236.1 transporter [Altererythrobacter sp. Root672]